MSDTFDAPGSRNEAILQNMLGANNPLEPPGSRIEDLLQQLLEKGSGSGLPDVTSADNGKVLGVENGAWGTMDAPSGLPDVTTADNGKVLKVANGVWGMGNNIRWLDGVYTYTRYTSAVLNAFQSALTTALQNNYTSYTMQVTFDSAETASAIELANDIKTAFSNNEIPVYKIIGVEGYQDTYCSINTFLINSGGASYGFDMLLELPLVYYLQGVGYIYGTAKETVFFNGTNATAFVKIDIFVDGAHS